MNPNKFKGGDLDAFAKRTFKSAFDEVSAPHKKSAIPELLNSPIADLRVDAAGDITANAVTSTFSAFNGGVLTVIGDALANNIAVSRNAAGQLLVNGGAVPILGGTPTVANTTTIGVFGLAGNDTLTLDETNGALPRANMFGGAGNDTITGGSGGDMLFGQSGNDTLLGKGGFDLLFGGSENDVLIGGDDDDQLFGESGDDRMIWNPGDDTDLHEGGAGNDTSEVNGGSNKEIFTVTANGARVRFDRVDPAPFSIDIGTTENLVVNMNGGDDEFSATGDLASLIKVTVDGGAGNDKILGSNGNDVLRGGDGDDFIDGQQGADFASLGAGNDKFQWDPGDGNDIVEGGDGTDTMLFNGSNGNEILEASANGGRARFTRDLGNIVMDINDVEVIDVKALGGTDQIKINDLSGTDVTEVKVDLAGVVGGTAGDGAADVVTVAATNGNNVIDIVGAGTSVTVLGLPAKTSITNSEGANDSLVVNGLGGNDTITATTLPAGVIKLTIDGGAGDDNISGSQGDDTLHGGDGNDFVFGDNGNDVAFMGAGDDVFQWNPGDGNDTVEGEAGTDTMRFFGSGANEEITISANGGRATFFRNVAVVTMDLNDVENIDFRALGGTDNIVVGDLSGTDVTKIDLDLRGPNGGGDGAADTITVAGTNGADVVTVAGDAGGVAVFGLQAQVNIFQHDAPDRLTVNALDGDDVVNASSLEADGIALTINGGRGDDILIGSEGNDTINGGDGNDTALMGAGDDTFVWNPGDDNDTLEGEAGFDTMLFNGANVDEQITISAAADGRTTFFRNVANVTMDLNETESIDFKALGGADLITINDLSGTDVTEINIDLTEAANLSGADTVVINATEGDDVVLVVGDGGGVTILGLAAQINITGFEANNDRLTINLRGGDDVLEASGLAASGIQLTGDGGIGDDVLVGGDGNDTLIGGAGDDVLIGGLGTDVLVDGEVVIQAMADPKPFLL